MTTMSLIVRMVKKRTALFRLAFSPNFLLRPEIRFQRKVDSFSDSCAFTLILTKIEQIKGCPADAVLQVFLWSSSVVYHSFLLLKTQNRAAHVLIEIHINIDIDINITFPTS